MPDLVDEIRVPLHELQADVDYLIGRILADKDCAPTIAASIKTKLAAVEAGIVGAAQGRQVRREDVAACLSALRLEASPNKDDDQEYGVSIVGHSRAVDKIMALLALAAQPPAAPGFFANLTPEQQEAALAYRGEENHGDQAYARSSAETALAEIRALIADGQLTGEYLIGAIKGIAEGGPTRVASGPQTLSNP